jgi:hypothetical protein
MARAYHPLMKIPLEIPPGVIVDDTTFSVGQTAWADVNNVRFWRGQPQVIGGWQRLTTTALTGVCRSIFPWTDNAGTLNIAFGTNSNLEVWINGSLYDITPMLATPLLDSGGNPLTDSSGNLIYDANGFLPGNVDGTGGSGYGTGAYGSGLYGEPSPGTNFPLTWSFAPWGQNLMACPRGQPIYQWTNNPAVPAATLANGPPQVTYMLVTNTRQVMALGCNEELSGTFNPRCIRFSDIENPTVWTTAVTNNAGEFILQGSGQIVGAQLIGNYVFVWTDNELYLGTYDPTLNEVGLPNGWTFPAVGENCGLIGPNAAVVLSDQAAYWFGSNGQIHACVLGGAPQIITCPMQEDVFSHVAQGQQAKIAASSTTEYGEIRFDYPDSRDGIENSRYFVYSSGGNLAPVAGYGRLDTVWSKGVMVRTAYQDAGPSPYPLGVDFGGNIYYHELGQSADGATFDAYAETADFYASDNVEEVLEARGIWPDIQAQVGAINLTIYSRLYPQDLKVRSRGPMALTPEQSKKDFLITGRILRIRYESTAAPMFWRLGRPVYDAVPAGLR